jgi:lipopolysaccharide biosynthesis protein
MRGYIRGKVVIRVVPNHGRDVGALLTGLATELDDYDLIGHIHSQPNECSSGKRAGNNRGDTWREFLWQNLVGGIYPMMDRILAAFEQEEHLGLVFPSDPYLIGWEGTSACAAELAQNLGWSGPLPEHLDFPFGNMFWLRRAALQPLLDLGLTWDRYPDESLSKDATLLYALERLTPVACRVAGLQSAVTHLPGVTW